MKPTVFYVASPYDSVVVGRSAFLLYGPLNHNSQLVSNNSPVHTSEVVKKGDKGEFETKNTIYIPFETPKFCNMCGCSFPPTIGETACKDWEGCLRAQAKKNMQAKDKVGTPATVQQDQSSPS